jgi:hypothetical protein
MKFFRESEKFWTKSALKLSKRFSGSGSTDWIGLMYCSIAANGKYVQRSKQSSIELFLTAFRSGDAHLIVGHSIHPSAIAVDIAYMEVFGERRTLEKRLLCPEIRCLIN